MGLLNMMVIAILVSVAVYRWLNRQLLHGSPPKRILVPKEFALGEAPPDARGSVRSMLNAQLLSHLVL